LASFTCLLRALDFENILWNVRFLKIGDLIYHMEKIVLFDAYGTLFKLDTDSEELDKLLGDRKAPFFDLWRQKLLEYSWLTSLMQSWEPFNTIVQKALTHASEVCEINGDEIAPVLMKIYENPSVFDDARKGLASLKEDACKCCVMSNGEYETLEIATDSNAIGDYIDQIFSASTVKAYKVSPLVYRMATAHYNIGPSNIFFVSSNAWDISGAQHFGYQTIWVNRNGKTFDALVAGPDYEVKTVTEAVSIVRNR